MGIFCRQCSCPTDILANTTQVGAFIGWGDDKTSSEAASNYPYLTANRQTGALTVDSTLNQVVMMVEIWWSEFDYPQWDTDVATYAQNGGTGTLGAFTEAGRISWDFNGPTYGAQARIITAPVTASGTVDVEVSQVDNGGERVETFGTHAYIMGGVDTANPLTLIAEGFLPEAAQVNTFTYAGGTSAADDCGADGQYNIAIGAPAAPVLLMLGSTHVSPHRSAGGVLNSYGSSGFAPDAPGGSTVGTTGTGPTAAPPVTDDIHNEDPAQRPSDPTHRSGFPVETPGGNCQIDTTAVDLGGIRHDNGLVRSFNCAASVFGYEALTAPATATIDYGWGTVVPTNHFAVARGAAYSINCV